MRFGRALQLLAPGYGTCYKCGTPWKFVKGHTTWYGDGVRGCFPLCEDCWTSLTPEQRLPYYEQLWLDWLSEGGPPLSEWEQIKEAVLSEDS